MAKISSSEKLLAQKTICLMLVRGNNMQNKPIYAYVAVRADKLDNFMKAQQKGNFDPEKYGVIIEAGEGDPSPEIQKKMQEEYGFNHEKMVNLPLADSENEQT